jgi:hypothetical protein
MKLLVALVALVLVAGCGEDEETPASSQAPYADLTVTVDKGDAKNVRCDTADDSDACRAIAGIDPKTFEPVPGNQACTQQYGGPETATVKGTLEGKEIDAKFSRVNGCEIERWGAAKPLFEAAG